MAKGLVDGIDFITHLFEVFVEILQMGVWEDNVITNVIALILIWNTKLAVNQC